MEHVSTYLTMKDISKIKPIAKVSVDSIEIVTQVGTFVTGSFDVKNIGGGILRGRIYSSIKYLSFQELTFEGNKISVEYSYQVYDIYHDKRFQDFIELVTNGGTIRIPIEIIIEDKTFATVQGKFNHLNDFAEYAIQNWDLAKDTFAKDSFINIFLRDSKEYLDIYKLCRMNPSIDQGLEEFFVGIKKKKSISLSVKAEDGIQKMIGEVARNHFLVEKDTWGYIKGTIWSDSDFIKVENPVFDRSNFVGNRMEVGYFIDPFKMHMGPNEGNIYIETYKGTIIHKVSCEKRQITKIYLDKVSYNVEDRPTLTVENLSGKMMTVTIEDKDNNIMSQNQVYQITSTTQIRLQFNLKSKFSSYKPMNSLKKLVHVVKFAVVIQLGTSVMKKDFVVNVAGYEMRFS